ncbi:MAG: hypothetical protein J7641_20215 [Cyanobacteria bacterium SID2]|nr:hypothetical protein [Cyanobacteria bacterium SID2]MBP0005339.1 hypothetical protein [Cyanobacteria bacterium SBC]
MANRYLSLAILLASQAAYPVLAQPRSSDRSSYREIEIEAFCQRYDIVASDLHAIATQLIEPSEFIEGRRREILSIEYPRFDREHATIEYTRIGLPDDSVRSIHHRLDLQQTPNGWEIEWVGAQYQCQRSSDPNLWTNQLCP